jgi:hypothetical protein
MTRMGQSIRKELVLWFRAHVNKWRNSHSTNDVGLRADPLCLSLLPRANDPVHPVSRSYIVSSVGVCERRINLLGSCSGVSRLPGHHSIRPG